MRFSSMSRSIRLFSLLVIVVVGFAVFSSTRMTGHAAGVANTIAHTQVNCGAWSVVPSANPSNTLLIGLYSVAAISTKDAWAVGSHENNQGQTYSLIEHWNGTSWRIASSPQLNGTLLSVAATTTNDVWAVGYSSKPGADNVLIEHWDGTNWSIISSPTPAQSTISSLSAVAIVATDNVWAVGGYYSKDMGQMNLIEHWNGTNWSIVSSPNASSSDYNALSSISVLSASNIWAVGGYVGVGKHPQRTLIEHWNGTSWSIVSSPNASGRTDWLEGVLAVSTNDVWAVGGAIMSNNSTLTLIEHWNGSKWSVVPSSNYGSAPYNGLSGIASISTDDVWTVGQVNGFPALTENWNGTSWSIVSNPASGALVGVTHIPGTNDLWAVGYTGNKTLTEFYC